MPELTPHQKKALNYNEHISLTANAGSGKTFVLSKRFVEIALNENISLRNIAAITFTDKAAGDLYKKIAGEIDGRIETETDRQRKYKLENIRRQLVSANISTIHSFCIDIIREFPIEANVDANFTPVDESYSGELVEHSVEEVLKEYMNSATDAEIVKSLIRFFGSKNKLFDELSSLVKNKKNVLNLKEKIYYGTDEETADSFFDSFNRLLDVTILAKKDEVIEAIKRINNTVLAENKKSDIAPVINGLLNGLDNDNCLERLALIAETIFTSAKQVRKQKYLAKPEESGLLEEIQLVEKHLPGIAEARTPANHRELELELARFGKNILVLLEEALKKYDDKKREAGYLDFEDILIITCQILENPDVREKLSEKYKYLMVDEYQDTNEIQYNIFLPILDYLQKNNLFVVGDEKQSIYMFRDAELEIFERTKNEIIKRNGSQGILELPDSFRMAPEICLFTNFLFGKIFKQGNSVYNEVKPNDIVCGRPDKIQGSVELLISRDYDETLDEAENKAQNPELADLIALRINELVNDENQPVRLKYNDIAVLCRKRKSFPELERVFSEHGIPYTILGGKGFYQKQLVGDFYNYFAFLLNPENETALAGILRSPFFSIDDAVLYMVSLTEGKTYWQKLKNYARKNEPLKNAVEQISKNLKLKNVFDIAQLFRKILAETYYIPVMSSQNNSETEIENLNKLINLSISFFNEGFKTLYDYVVFLNESISFSEDEGQAEPVVNDDVVKIMTIHQSKGLEYDSVFLFRCNEKTQKSLVRSKSIIVDKHFGLLTKTPLDNKYFEDYHSAPIVFLANHITERKEIAEMKRLFYVAVTRAKTHLYISAEYNKGKFSEESMMGLLQEAFQIDFDAEKYILKSELTFLLNDGAGYYNKTSKLNLEIPIISNINYRKPEKVSDAVEITKYKNMAEKIIDYPADEIFSATKIATYIQCPFKYKLNFEYDFNPLFTDFLSVKKGKPAAALNKSMADEVEFSKIPELVEEEKVNINPAIKGKIIHSILQNGIKEDKLKDFIKEQLGNNLFVELRDEAEIDLFISNIIKDLKIYFDSEIYKEISASGKFYNEFELFVKENDYILHGIIDKIVIKEDGLLIIDYKTDDLNKSELEERFKSYLSQLKFYSYIVYKHFKFFNNLVVKVIFIKYPDVDLSATIDLTALPTASEEYAGIIKNIRNRIFPENRAHCPSCIYSSIGNKCIASNL